MQQNKPETLPISRAQFAELEIFKNVQFEKVAGFLFSCQTFVAEPGEKVIDPENNIRRLIILLEGKLCAKMNSSEETSFEHEILPGHCAGEMSVFDNIDPSAAVYAKEKSTLLEIPAEVAMSMLKSSHELCLNFLHILSQRIRNNNKIVCEEQYHIRCMEEYAKVDPMTGLHNRRWLEEMYTREMSRSNKGNFKLSALMMDIDHFKNVNDTYGHLVGDQVLISVAQALIRSLRPSDMPVRYGGEEFTVFLPSATGDNARMVAERIRKNVENMSIALADGTILQVTISIGIAERINADTVSSIIERADKALYYAKENGRNRACMNLGEKGMKLVQKTQRGKPQK